MEGNFENKGESIHFADVRLREIPPKDGAFFTPLAWFRLPESMRAHDAAWKIAEEILAGDFQHRDVRRLVSDMNLQERRTFGGVTTFDEKLGFEDFAKIRMFSIFRTSTPPEGILSADWALYRSPAKKVRYYLGMIPQGSLEFLQWAEAIGSLYERKTDADMFAEATKQSGGYYFYPLQVLVEIPGRDAVRPITVG